MTIKTESTQLLKLARAEWDRIGKIAHETFQKLVAAGLNPITLEQTWMQETA
jgi:hypothetical protein